MGIDKIIIIIMTIFMAIGGIDKIFGNKLGYGEKFEEGIMAMGSLAVAMVGIISLAPVLGNLLTPVVGPIYSALGADPAMFATTLLANDMGGAPLALGMAKNPEAGKLAAFILGSMMGPTIVFTIPVALGIIEKEDKPFLAKGILAGITTIPLGVLAGGIVAGFPIGLILVNLIPIIIVAGLIILGLIFIPEKMTKGFAVFGQLVVAIITIGLVAAIIQELTGFVVIPDMIKNNRGHIINIGSTAGIYPYAGAAVYCASKAAVRYLSDGIRIDTVDKNIKVTTVQPGIVETNFSKVRFHGDEEKAGNVYKGIEALKPEDIADIIAYVANQPEHVQISDITVMVTKQATGFTIHREQ